MACSLPNGCCCGSLGAADGWQDDGLREELVGEFD
jgi:hypothetical protein